jgi:hypothetical protein
MRDATYITAGYVQAGYVAGSNFAAFGQPSVVLVQLVWLGFATPIALNTSTWDITFAGVTYKGAYGLGQISPITDKPGEAQGLTLELAGGDSASIALALDDADQVQGTPVIIRSAVLDGTNYQVLDAPIEWLGSLDTMSIAEDGSSASIRVTAESAAADLLRGTPFFYTDADQLTVSATDRSFKYVVDQIDKPVVWPAKSWFYK